MRNIAASRSVVIFLKHFDFFLNQNRIAFVVNVAIKAMEGIEQDIQQDIQSSNKRKNANDFGNE
jgi:hypothetical protein